MSTELEELRAESRALVTFGVARYEDSVVFSAVRRYLVDVGQISHRRMGYFTWNFRQTTP